MGAVFIVCGGFQVFGGTKVGASGFNDLMIYIGFDCDQKLVVQAKKEGVLFVYMFNTVTEVAAKEFGTLHPDIKVMIYLVKVIDFFIWLKVEIVAHKVGGDFIGMSNADMPQANAAGYLVFYYSLSVNEQLFDMVKAGLTKGIVMFVVDCEDYMVMGWNTKLIIWVEVLKTYDDLLDSKWKGKMVISGHMMGINWFGVVVDAKGEDFVKKLKAQQICVQDVFVVVLADLVFFGEVLLSPNLGLFDVIKLIGKGAPLDWVFLEFVLVAGGSDGVFIGAKYLVVALMFIDYLYSKEGQQFMVGQGVLSLWEDVFIFGLNLDDVKFTLEDVLSKYSSEEYAQKYMVWQNLMHEVFVS